MSMKIPAAWMIASKIRRLPVASMIKEEEKKLRLMPLYFARREVVCEPSNTQA